MAFEISTTWLSVIILTVFVISLLMRVPVSFSMALAALVGMLIMGKDLRTLPQLWSTALKSYTISAIPFFILAGNIMNTGGITNRIFNFARVLVGHVIGGLGHVVIVACMIFSGISGSFTADAAGIGTVAKHAIKNQGYEKEFGAAIVASASILGPIIPPSILFIYYGCYTGLSISKLFLAGLIPGVLSGLLLMLVCFLVARSGKVKAPTYERASWKDIWTAFKESILAILAPGIIIIGMLTGWVTPTEAAILACMYSLIVSAIYRDIEWRNLPKILLDSARTSANAQFLVAAASMVGWLVTVTKVTEVLSTFITNHTTNTILVLLMINIYLLIQGCFIDTTSGLILITPVIYPIALQFGVDPIHFGVIICYNLILGALTPPMGAGLYLVSSVMETRVERLIRSMVPFFAIHIVTLLIITYIPILSTWLPGLLD
jgi:tripartite ATP-independent transporter DctM subunit